MNERRRIECVFRGERPDQVPFMLDLSHWYYHRERRPWDISTAYTEPEWDLIDEHRRLGAGFYMPNLASFYETVFPQEVEVTSAKVLSDGQPEIVWSVRSSAGTITRRRRWEPQSYAWGVTGWGIETACDLAVFADAMSGRRFRPRWDRFDAWNRAVGDIGVVYLPLGYSAVGHLLHYWMGIERFVYATVDYPETLQEAIRSVNRNQLELVDLACSSPAEIVIMGDNFSSDVQSPAFFETWSADYYREAVRRLHQAGKKVAVHIDGALRGALAMIRDIGADCADAVTPGPFGDLTPRQCRDEAGGTFILSGGVPPDVWLPYVPMERFEQAVSDWLALAEDSSALIANAGDQVPPGAEERRIVRMREMVDEHAGKG